MKLLVWAVNHFFSYFGEQNGHYYLNFEVKQIELPNHTKAFALVLHWETHLKSKKIWCLATFLVVFYTFQFCH